MVVAAQAFTICTRDQGRKAAKSNVNEKGARSLFPVRDQEMTPTTASANPNKALWEKGDFTEIAAFMRHSGEALVDTLNVSAGLRVLDLGCGDGTTALPLARKGAEVTGIDIAHKPGRSGQQACQSKAGLRPP